MTKYRNLKIKSKPIEYGEPDKKSKSRNNNIIFIKQIPMHPRDRLNKLNKLRKTDKVKFIKQLPLQLRGRLKRKRKEELDNHNDLSKKSKNDAVVFIKQVPIHPRDRLKKLEPTDEKIKYIKQVPLHPWDRLQRIDRKLEQPRNRMKNIEDQVARDNVSKLMRDEFDFNPGKILYKTLMFDTNKIDEEIIMDMMIDALNNKTNDEHPVDSDYFSLKREDGR